MQAVGSMIRLATVLLALIVSVEAQACSCFAEISVEEAFQHADAIFAGVVVSIEDRRNRRDDSSGSEHFAVPAMPPHLDPDRGRTVTFRVLQWWKNDALTDVVKVRTGYGGGDCGYPVEEGKSYLVYARRNLQNELTFGICGRNAALICASDDVAELGQPIKTYAQFDVQSLIETEQPYTTYWRRCIKPPVLIGDRGLRMKPHCRFDVTGVITTEGTVRDFEIVSRPARPSCPESLDDHVRKRVAEWRFLPAEFEGMPIETFLTKVSLRTPMNDSEYAAQLKEQAEWEAKRKPE